MGDTFYTLESASEGCYKEKMSKFLAFAVPVSGAAEAKVVWLLYTSDAADDLSVVGAGGGCGVCV